jgi:hypothetical protein
VGKFPVRNRKMGLTGNIFYHVAYAFLLLTKIYATEHRIKAIPYRSSTQSGLTERRRIPLKKFPIGTITETRLSVKVDTLPKRDWSICFWSSDMNITFIILIALLLMKING